MAHFENGSFTVGADRALLVVADEIAAPRRAILTLPQGGVLVHEISLPSAAERELERAIELHVERELPLPRAQVCIDWRIVSRDREHRRILVKLLVAHRDHVEQARERATECGLRPVRICMADTSGQMFGDVLPRTHGPRRMRLTPLEARLALTTAVLGVVALGLIAGQSLYERRHVEAALARVTALSGKSNELARRLVRDSAGGSSLARLMKKPDAGDVLGQLTTSLPRDTWVYEVDIAPAQNTAYQIKVAGFTPTATVLVEQLEKTPQLDHVRLGSASSAGLGSGLDRIQLTAGWAEQ